MLSLTRGARQGDLTVFLSIPVPDGGRRNLDENDPRSVHSFRKPPLETESAQVRLEGVASEPVVSALRGFSAPVKLETDAPADHDYVLLAADSDQFNRWESGQRLATADAGASGWQGRSGR